MKTLSLSIALACLTLSMVYVFAPQATPPVVTHPTSAKAKDMPTVEPKPFLLLSPVPELTATSVYIFDPDSETVLYQKNANQSVPPASVTKMMTALIANEVYRHDMVVSVPPFQVEGQKMDLFQGEKISIESLLYGTLVYSANDAAEVFAKIYPGGSAAFIARMNERASEIGMNTTSFKNPTGLDSLGHLSTARDMAILGLEVMKNDSLRQIVGTTKGSVLSADGKIVHRLLATNKLLSTVPGVLGIKTGWTETAHENLVTYITRDNHTIIISLFGSDDRFGETKTIIDWVFGNTQW